MLSTNQKLNEHEMYACKGANASLMSSAYNSTGNSSGQTDVQADNEEEIMNEKGLCGACRLRTVTVFECCGGGVH